MMTSIERSAEGPVLIIRASENLDFSQHDPFCRACKDSREADLSGIDVDMAATRLVFDSGIGMLMMLARHARQRNQSLRLINCSDQVRRRLSEAGLPTLCLIN